MNEKLTRRYQTLKIPNYLRTITNKYKGLITEKIAFNYLQQQGFICEHFVGLSADITFNWKQWYEHKKKRYERDLRFYSSETKPNHWSGHHGGRPLKWEEYRLEALERAKRGLEEIKHRLPIDLHRQAEEESRRIRIWGEYLEQIEQYREWLRNEGHYNPDFIAQKNGKIYIIEVKSQSFKGKTAIFWKHQRRALLKAKDFGFIPKLLTVPFNFKVEFKEPKLKEL